MNAKIIFVLAIVAGLEAVFMVRNHVDNLRGETITIFTAAADFEEGELIGSDVEEVSIPSGLFPNLLQHAPTSDLRDLIETTELREDINAGEILLFSHFDSAVDDGLIPEIPPGKKAISIAVTEESAVSYFIKPGDLVDVLATFLGGEEAAGPQQNVDLFNVSTRPIVQAARVLAVGGDYRKSDRQSREPYSSVTLLVSMEEAAKLIFARDFFSVTTTLVLRGEDDTVVEKVLPEVGINTLNFDRIGNTPAAESAR
jgi:pilus assembly protein CpaB